MAIYDNFPVWMKDIFYSSYGAWLLVSRYGRKYKKIEEEVFKREHLSLSEIRSYQLKKIQNILEYASNYIPYYKQLYKKSKIDTSNINSLEKLKELPIITRNEIQAHIPEFTSTKLSSFQYRIESTSGSTGTGLRFPIIRDAERYIWATIWRYRKRFNMDRKKWCAQFYGRFILPVKQEKPPFWVVNNAGKQIFFSGFHLNDRNMHYFIKELNKRKPECITGHSSLLTSIAQYILNHNSFLSYKPSFIGTSSEALLDFQKKIIERGFQTKCHQHYGQSEGISLISECRAGNLHVDEDLGYIEFVNNGDNSYKMITTGFYNYAFPFIRYDIGDTVRLYRNGYTCTCGLPGRTVKFIEGKIQDHIVTPGGKKIKCLYQLFKDVTFLENVQLVQKAVDEVVIKIIPNNQFDSNSEKIIIKKMLKYLGDEINYTCKIVDNIPCGKSGKHRFILSELE